MPEMSAREAFTDFLAGDYEKLNFRCYDFFQNWQYCCSVGRLEYTLMDVDGDGSEELLVQYEDDPQDIKALFDYADGWIECWELDCVESCRWSELLADGTMLRRYAGNGAYTFYRWLPDGSMEELGPALKYVGDAEFADIYGGLGWTIDDVAVDEALFQAKLRELVTDRLPSRDI